MSSESYVPFDELAQLNAGVVLQPLVAVASGRELDPTVAHDIASLPKAFVYEVIAGHTADPAESPEAKNLGLAYRDLRSASHRVGASITNTIIDKPGFTPEPEAVTEPTIEETVQALLYGEDGSLALEAIQDTVAVHPTDPHLPYVLGAELSKHNASIGNISVENDDYQAERLCKAYDVAIDGYLTHLFGNKAIASDDTYLSIISSWMDVLKDAHDNFEISILVSVIRGAIVEYDRKGTLPKALALTNVLYGAMVKNAREGTMATDEKRSTNEEIGVAYGMYVQRLSKETAERADELISSISLRNGLIDRV